MKLMAKGATALGLSVGTLALFESVDTDGNGSGPNLMMSNEACVAQTKEYVRVASAVKMQS